MRNNVDTCDRILALMHDMELILCGNCVQKTRTPECCNIDCEIRFAEMARRMVEGRDDTREVQKAI